MSAGFRVPSPQNDPVKNYSPGSPERTELLGTLERMGSETVEIPAIIGAERKKTGRLLDVRNPCDHKQVLAKVHAASASDVKVAIDRALTISPVWSAMPFVERAAIFLKAADMLAGPWRQRINASCMLGQAKTVHQAEIDASCELVDFLRFNVAFAERIYDQQPISSPGIWNRAEYRPLEGFVLAVAPFNFLSIAINLAVAPALMGNVVLLKPSTTSAFGVWQALEMLHEAGLPEGVISWIPGDGPEQGTAALESEHLAGIHFTGSTATFKSLWKGVAERLDTYRTFPRLVGETGGKDFIVVHPSADVDAVVTAIVRGGYEYQGQKCSAASRVYAPKSLWPKIRDGVRAQLAQVKVGDVRDLSNFMGAVIDERSFTKISGYQKLARDTAKVHFGGGSDSKTGWFVEPTFVEVDDPKHRLMQEEIFGPVLTTWVYDDAKWDEMLALVNTTSPYALTGAVFARDRKVLSEVQVALRNAAGNFYINDKPTGAVVGQQPFGGARQSGTNDKAGSMWNLARWVSPRTLKEALLPPTDWRYPYLGE